MNLFDLASELKRRKQSTKFWSLFEDKTKYPKHNLFFEVGSKYRQRLFMAGNRVGKTTAALCEIVMHMSGKYPETWTGKRFEVCNNWWLVGRDSKTVKDTLQMMLLGKVGEFGTGIIPVDLLDFNSLVEAKKSSSGVESFRIKHVSGAWSQAEFRTAEAGRAAFQGTERSILIDEECPLDVYTECLLRTLTGGNILIMTFTPLFGSTDLIEQFYGGKGMFKPGDFETGAGKFAIQTSMDECPHLSPADVEEILASCPPHQRDARRKGIPELSAGSIFPVPEEFIKIEPIQIPEFWPRWYGMDVGWKNTAACWFAQDPETKMKYVTHVYKRGEVEPVIHAAAIKKPGDWLKGAIDSAANASNQADGKKLMELYQGQGLNLVNAVKSVEAGLWTCYNELATGQIKIFSTCSDFFDEYKQYKRDSKGKVIKENDHVMDSFRYGVMTPNIAQTKPVPMAYNQGVSPQFRIQRKF